MSKEAALSESDLISIIDRYTERCGLDRSIRTQLDHLKPEVIVYMAREIVRLRLWLTATP